MSKSAVRVALLVVCCIPLLSAAAITRTWTGAVSSAFSEPNNWSPAGAPAPADSLSFPAGSNLTMTNDLPAGTSFGPMTFDNDNGMVLSGNPMTLTGDVTFNSSSWAVAWNADVKIGASLTVHAGNSSGFDRFNGAVDVNGQTLTVSGLLTVKTLNGSGTVATGGNRLTITDAGTFNGTMTGYVEVDGAIPNASLANHGTLGGTGKIGSVDAGQVTPGACCSNAFGVLTTKSLVISGTGAGAHFDLNPADPTGGSDSIHVTGTVTLSNPTFSVSLPAGLPTAGQQFTVIQNDGSDAVSGTFAGLPEGSVFDVNGADFSISYHGGDGNDVVLTVTAVQKSWAGAVSSLWSNSQNWKPAVVPAPGEPLLFPAGSNLTMTNDLPAGTSFGPMTFDQDNGAVLSGNLMTLTGNITLNSTNWAFAWNADIKIGSSLTLNARNSSGLDKFNGAVDVNGQTLTITGMATIKTLSGSGVVIGSGNRLTITDAGTFNGTMTGYVEVDGSIPNASLVNHGTLGGTGTIGNVDAGEVSPGACCSNAFGVLTTKSLSISGTGAGAHFDLNATDPTGQSDSIHVTGTVTLNNPPLSVSVAGQPSLGESFVIIANDGTDPVAGTFAGLPEGATVSATGHLFRLTYGGGDGNDVELISATQPDVAVSQSTPSSVVGEMVSLSATVSSQFGTPPGTVTFTDNGASLGVVSLVNGTAALNVPLATTGNHSIAVVYSGGSFFVSATSSPLTHSVGRGDTTTSFADTMTPLYGQTRVRTTTVARLPAAGTVTGSVTLAEGGNAIGTALLSGGTAIFNALTLQPGAHTFTATYGGSASFNGSSSVFQVTVDRAATHLDVSIDGSVLEIFVYPFAAVQEVPTGSVTISENGTVIRQQPITGNTTLTLTLGPGHHALHVVYSGDSLFQESASDIDVDGGSPSRHRAVRH